MNAIGMDRCGAGAVALALTLTSAVVCVDHRGPALKEALKAVPVASAERSSRQPLPTIDVVAPLFAKICVPVPR